MTRAYFPCVLLAALAYGLVGCDSDEESDSDGSSTVTVTGSEGESFEGNAVFVVDETDFDGEPFVVLVLFEGLARDLDDDDDYVAFLWEERAALDQGDYGVDFLEEPEDEVLAFYKRDDNLLVGVDGEVSVSAASSSQISGTFGFDAVEFFGEETGVPISGRFQAVRVDTTDLPGLYEDSEFSGDENGRTGIRSQLRTWMR